MLSNALTDQFKDTELDILHIAEKPMANIGEPLLRDYNFIANVTARSKSP